MALKIAMVGKGNVGQALGAGLSRAGHEIRYASQDPNEPVKDAAEWADVVILAVPWGAHIVIANAAEGSMDGKPVIDVSNVMTPQMELAIGFSISGAEELQRMIPNAKVVKAFNTVFAKHMSTGKLNGEPLTVFLAGDDALSKETVASLAKDIGFDAVDSGPLKTARYLEPLGMLNILLGYGLQMGTDIGLKLMR